MQAYKIMARKNLTGTRIQRQDLRGNVITNYEQAMQEATAFAQKHSARMRETWLPEVALYTVGHKPKLTR